MPNNKVNNTHINQTINNYRIDSSKTYNKVDNSNSTVIHKKVTNTINIDSSKTVKNLYTNTEINNSVVENNEVVTINNDIDWSYFSNLIDKSKTVVNNKLVLIGCKTKDPVNVPEPKSYMLLLLAVIVGLIFFAFNKNKNDLK